MTDGSQLEDVWGSILPAKFIKDVWLDVEAKKPEDWELTGMTLPKLMTLKVHFL